MKKEITEDDLYLLKQILIEAYSDIYHAKEKIADILTIISDRTEVKK